MRNRNQLDHHSNTNVRDLSSTPDDIGPMNLRDYLHVPGNANIYQFLNWNKVDIRR